MPNTSTPPLTTETPPFLRGRGDPPVPFQADDQVIKLAGCPDCTGRGWFLINPFATGGGGGAGGLENMTQCRTCVSAHKHYEAHGVLPNLVIELMAAKKSASETDTSFAIGKKLKDNDPRMASRKEMTITEVLPAAVIATDGVRSRQYLKSRIFTDGKPRKSGLSLVP